MTPRQIELLNLSFELQESMVLYQKTDYFPSKGKYTYQDVINIVSDYFCVSFASMQTRTRITEIKTPRFFCMYFIRRFVNREEMSLVNIGKIFGGRDHTTVINAVRIVSERLMNKNENDLYKTYHSDLCDLFKINAEDDKILAIGEYSKRCSVTMKPQKKIIRFPAKEVKEIPVVSIDRKFPGDRYSNKNHWAAN